jgi:metal-dependent HD superfamily phosphatase/phosphodiesterase
MAHTKVAGPHRMKKGRYRREKHLSQKNIYTLSKQPLEKNELRE